MIDHTKCKYCFIKKVYDDNAYTVDEVDAPHCGLGPKIIRLDDDQPLCRYYEEKS